MIKDICIRDMKQLTGYLDMLPNRFVFRGHANSKWKLESTLERLLDGKWDPESVEKFEKYSKHIFTSKFDIYNTEESKPETLLAWLAMMQHYGVPTRLLDFTTSPYVALYFAVEGNDSINPTEFCVYALDCTAINAVGVELIKSKDKAFVLDREDIGYNPDDVFENTIDRFSYDIAWITEPGNMNIRIDRQSGCFLICGSKGIRLQEIIASDAYRECDMFRFVIPGELYPNAFALLRKMNINGKTIYGDLQGLARSIRMELSVYAS